MLSRLRPEICDLINPDRVGSGRANCRSSQADRPEFGPTETDRGLCFGLRSVQHNVIVRAGLGLRFGLDRIQDLHSTAT